ncbi:MAG: hypothetical protein H6Q67_43 [Firmicutes bacterium]|nr:hypothetical protein [Bacillota bacterium]
MDKSLNRRITPLCRIIYNMGNKDGVDVGGSFRSEAFADRTVKYIIGITAAVLTTCICSMLEDFLQNPQDIPFRIFRFIIFFILFIMIASALDFIIRLLFKKAK